jgi:hypothetical protein
MWRPKTDISDRLRQRCAPMSKELIGIAEAISLSDLQAHPAEAMAALIETVRRQGEEITHLQENFGIAMSIIAKLKNSRIKPDGKKTSARLSTIEYLLIANGNEPLTFAEIGKRLELGSRNGKKDHAKAEHDYFREGS